ncbi:leucine-rich repeat-containing protein 26 isoform X2 [Pseudoliparis swirei]|nr:leucine-rich repeat-containing protein 26 isoform X2 [Pseudoliparis swirei]
MLLRRRGALLMLALLVETAAVGGCPCPAATVLSRFPSEVPADACCLNFSGSAFGHVLWSALTNGTAVATLDLSSCNISSVLGGGGGASTLRKVYLARNGLTALPREFLAGCPGLTEVDLSGNLIQELPEGFLRGSDRLRKLDLRGNRLRLLPGALLQKPRLQTLQLEGNPWDCSCALLEGLEAGRKLNGTAALRDLLGNLTCVSPRRLAGRAALSVRRSDACRPAGLTALFIVLPLVILAALVLCWCCGRKRREAPVSASKKRRSSGAACNGQKHRGKQKAEPGRAAGGGGEGIPGNQLQLRPAAALLGGTGDVYEEVEVKLAECLPRASGSPEGGRGPQGTDGAGQADLDSVSVTEVMKDSADREKAYLTQSTEYYSLVPGLQLEDSDRGEDEDVGLS